MIVGPIFTLVFVYCASTLRAADVTYVEGNGRNDLKVSSDSNTALFGSSASIQSKGFSANFSRGNTSASQENPGYIQRSQDREDVFSSTPTASTSTQPINENFANVVYKTTTRAAPRSEKVIYYSTAAPKTQRVIYDSTLSSVPTNQKVGYYSSSSPRSQQYTDNTFYSAGSPSYDSNYLSNSGVQYSTPQYQPTYASATPNLYATNYQPVYQGARNERVIPIYEPSQEYNLKSQQKTLFAPKATIQVPYVSQRQEVQAHDQQQEFQQQPGAFESQQGQQDFQSQQGFQQTYQGQSGQQAFQNESVQVIPTQGDNQFDQQEYNPQIDYPQEPDYQFNQSQSNYQPQPDQTYQGPESPAVVQKRVNVVTPVVRKTTYEIRKPAIEKQLFDIEERVIVRPAGTVVVELNGPVSKISKGETVTDIGQGRIAPSQSPQTVGGVTYAENSPRPKVFYNGESGYSTTSQSPVDYENASQGPTYSSSTPSSYPEDRNQISPHMISRGDPDFNEPPYVSSEKPNEQQSNGEEAQNYGNPPRNGNLYLGKQSQYVPFTYNQNGRDSSFSAKQVAYSPQIPCEQGTGFIGRQGYVGGSPLYTYFTVQSPQVAFRSYNNRATPSPAATLPPPPEEGEVEEIDVNEEQFQSKSGRFSYNNNQRQQSSGKLTETENKQIYNDLLSGTNNITFNITDGTLGPGERVISATPAPFGVKPASETLQKRRIVVNHPFETVRVVEEEEQQAKVQEVTVNQQVQPARYRSRLVQTPNAAQLRVIQYRQPVYQQQYYSRGYPSAYNYRS